MAIQISGTTVIGNSLSLENVSTGSSTITSLRSGITTTSSNITLSNRQFCTVVSAGVTVTLPASPAAGNEVAVGVTTGITNTVIGRNSQNIMGLAEDMTIDVENVTVNLFFTDATRGWRVV